MYNIILEWARLFLRIYFKRTIVHGRENVPKDGPLIVASNHPSAFMEASVLATLVGRQIHFLVRGDVFNPKFRFLFEWTNQIPIYRQKDGISNLRKNASSFDLTYKKLAAGNAVLIFPEAKTTLEKKMRPIQRGTAHLAFGTMPLLANGTQLKVIPVGVNFMDPRVPGTDVIIRFGTPFVTQHASREDREAIEAFTETLSNAIEPLIIQVYDHANEQYYDVLASVYLDSSMKKQEAIDVHNDLMKIANLVNHLDSKPELKDRLKGHIALLKSGRMKEGIFFPGITKANSILIGLQIILKVIWLLLGGWLWRLVRKIIFSKLRTETFQGPTSLGASMVAYPLLSLIFLLICAIVGWPIWYVMIWWLLLAMGKLIAAPLPLLLKRFTTQAGLLKTLKSNISYFEETLQQLV